MKKYTYAFLLPVIMILFFTACNKDDEEKDTQKPLIDMAFESSSPKPCDTVQLGQDFIFRARFNDNVELGSFNLELHHNFDHHTHGSHTDTCPMEPDKEAINPFYYNENFSIPEGLVSYNAEVTLSIPADVDPGDYHFMVKLTDQEGWQSWQSVSIKIL